MLTAPIVHSACGQPLGMLMPEEIVMSLTENEERRLHTIEPRTLEIGGGA